MEMEPCGILVAEVSGNKRSPLQEESPGQHHEYTMQKYEVDEGGFAVCLFFCLVSRHAVSSQDVEIIRGIPTTNKRDRMRDSY